MSSESATCALSVLYRFRVRPGQEAAFRAAWADLTRAIRDTRGGLGSRLHHVDGDLWAAYAQWPDRAAWEAAMAAPSADPAASAAMGAAMLESLEPLLLTPTDDLLQPVTIAGT